MNTLLDNRQCDTMQEAMTYASAATILGLGFDMSLVKIVNEWDSKTRYVISVYDAIEEREGEIEAPEDSSALDQFELDTTDDKTGMYL